ARRSGPNDRRGTVRPAVRGFRPRSLRRAAVRRTEPVHRGLPVVRPGPAPDGGPAPGLRPDEPEAAAVPGPCPGRLLNDVDRRGKFGSVADRSGPGVRLRG